MLVQLKFQCRVYLSSLEVFISITQVCIVAMQLCNIAQCRQSFDHQCKLQLKLVQGGTLRYTAFVCPKRCMVNSFENFKVSEDVTYYPFQPSIAFHIETSRFICCANHMTGFYMKCNAGLKSANCFRQSVFLGLEQYNQFNNLKFFSKKGKCL